MSKSGSSSSSGCSEDYEECEYEYDGKGKKKYKKGKKGKKCKRGMAALLFVVSSFMFSSNDIVVLGQKQMYFCGLVQHSRVFLLDTYRDSFILSTFWFVQIIFIRW